MNDFQVLKITDEENDEKAGNEKNEFDGEEYEADGQHEEHEKHEHEKHERKTARIDPPLYYHPTLVNCLG